MRKIYVILVILLTATIAMAYFYFNNLQKKDHTNELALNAVAGKCGIVFAFDNDRSFYEILSGQDLLQQTLGKTKAQQLKNLNRLIQSPTIFAALEGQKTFVGLNATDQQINFLIATQLKATIEVDQLVQTIKNKKLKINPDGDLYQLTFADSSSIFLAFRKNLVLVSNARAELPPASTTYEQTVFSSFVKENSRFNKNTLANLYVNFDQLPTLLKNIVTTPINGELSVFEQRKCYAALTYSFSKNKLLFNGNTTVDTTGSYYQLFANLPAQQLTVDQVFPSGTANYATFAIGSYANWHKSLSEWMATVNQKEKVLNQLSRIEQQYRVNLPEFLPKYFRNQFATFQLRTGEKLGIVSLTNGDKVEQLLLDISADYAPEIKIFKEPLIPFAFFGEPFRKFERPFYTIIDNFLVLANNASTIQSFLRSYAANAFLIHDENYTDFKDQLSTEATICFYVNNKNSVDIFRRNLKPDFFEHYQSASGFKPYNAFCYQLVGDRGKFLTNFLLAKYKEETTPADTTAK